ncbi:MAG: accessory factor UbiK family protein [Mariprofundaceae bacterium]
MRIDNAMLDELAEKIADGLKLLGGVKDEAQAQVRSTLEGVFQSMDVVTREQMEVQQALLDKVREELTVLEERVKELESGKRKK